jgi:hypothetical protein
LEVSAETLITHLQGGSKYFLEITQRSLVLQKSSCEDLNHCIHTLAGAGANSGGRRSGGGVRVSARGAPAGPPGVVGVPSPAGGAAGGPLGGAQGQAAA